MAYDDVLTRNENEELAVRVVNSTEGSNSSTYDDIYTRDTNGKLAVRVVGAGGGGSDVHNLGWYADLTALQTAHPTGSNGDYAIVGSTDSVWVWDEDTTAWVNTAVAGTVTSVNNQTGAVTITLSDLGGQAELVSGTNIKTIDGNSVLGSGNLELSTYLTYPAGWTTNSTTKAFCDDIAADTTAVAGKAYLGEVTFSDLPASLGNGEVIVEIMDGTTVANKVIVLTLTSGNNAPYMWKYTYWNGGANVSGWQTWATAAQGAKADTAVQPADLATVATTGAYSDLSGTPTIPEATQVSTMPTAGVSELGKIYQYTGTTDANYTNGYFYKCVSDGQDPATYSWTAIQVQASSGGGLPDQTGQSGKFLTTDGTDASWSDKPLVNTAPGSNSLTILGNTSNAFNAINIGSSSTATSSGVAVGVSSYSFSNSVAIGCSAKVTGTGHSNSIAIGNNAQVQAAYAIQLGAAINSDNNTVKIANENGNYEIMSADGTIPSDRLVHAINKYSTMPTAASTNEGWIVQFTGTTDSTYTHGHLYECVSDGQTPATYSWTEVSMGGGGSSYTAGTGIDITSGVISVTAPTLQNVATASSSITIGGTAGYPSANNNVVVGTFAHVGYNQYSTSSGNIVIGGSAIIRNGVGNIAIGSGAGDASITSMQYGIAIGTNAKYNANYAIQLGGDTQTNSDANTFKVGNANGNFEIMSADGTVPTARLTKVNSTITLTAAGWSSNTQTVSVTGMTATGVVLVSPDPTDQADYTSAGIYCSAQAAGTLTFTCSTTPTNDIDVVVVML